MAIPTRIPPALFIVHFIPFLHFYIALTSPYGLIYTVYKETSPYGSLWVSKGTYLYDYRFIFIWKSHQKKKAGTWLYTGIPV